MILDNRDSFNSYVKSINNFDLIKDDKHERELLRRIKDGDLKAEHELIMANTKFVIFVAKKYQWTANVDFQELVSEGNIGLINAARKFDLNNEVKFISYAVWWIRQAITKYINENSRIVRVPVNVINDVNRDKSILSEDEISKKYTLPISVSMESQIGDEDGNFTLSDVLSSEDEYKIDIDEINLNKVIEEALENLLPRERDIVKKYYGLNDGVNWSLESIAEEYELTKERVRQIKNKAITKLRHNSDLFYEFFD